MYTGSTARGQGAGKAQGRTAINHGRQQAQACQLAVRYVPWGSIAVAVCGKQSGRQAGAQGWPPPPAQSPAHHMSIHWKARDKVQVQGLHLLTVHTAAGKVWWTAACVLHGMR